VRFSIHNRRIGAVGVAFDGQVLRRVTLIGGTGHFLSCNTARSDARLEESTFGVTATESARVADHPDRADHQSSTVGRFGSAKTSGISSIDQVLRVLSDLAGGFAKC
jgi:hypothetical protein